MRKKRIVQPGQDESVNKAGISGASASQAASSVSEAKQKPKLKSTVSGAGSESAAEKAQKKVTLVKILQGAPTGDWQEAVPGAKKASNIKETMEKRRRQYRHLMTALQVAIRPINAFDRKTIRVK